MKKNTIIPPNTNGIIKSAFTPNPSIASGINPKNAAASRTPVAKDIKIGISNF
jgi:hypothetical protein